MHLAIGTREVCGGLLLAAGVLVGSLIGCQALSGRAGERSALVSTPVALGPRDGQPRGGNEVLLLRDGSSAEQAALGAIAAARDHIHVHAYAFDDDAAGQRLARALMARQARGVSVHVLRDAAGTRDTPDAFFTRLTDAGVQVQVSPPGDGGAGYHRQLLIVDGHTAFVGGIPPGSDHSAAGLSRTAARAQADGAGSGRDTDLRLRGPVVADLQRLFLADWADHGGPPLPARGHFPAPAEVGSAVVSAIASQPGDDPHPVQALLLAAIDHARHSVHLGNARFMADDELLDTLEAAARRGVAVHLVVPGRGDSWLLLQAGRSHYARLLRAGVHIHERRGSILHARTALVDGRWALVGSSNLDWARTARQRELHTVVTGQAFGARLQALFERDIAMSDEVDPVAWNGRSTDQRWREAFGRAWAWWY